MDAELVLKLLVNIAEKQHFLSEYIEDLVNNFRFDLIWTLDKYKSEH